MKVDALVEIRATFYEPGDVVSLDELDEHTWTDALEMNADLTDSGEGEPAFDKVERQADGQLKFLTACIALDATNFSDCRCDDGYGSGIEFEESEGSGKDWLTEDHENWCAQARAVRVEMEANIQAKAAKRLSSVFDSDGIPYEALGLPLRRVRWIEAAGYWSSSYDGEHDGGVEFYGRFELRRIKPHMLDCPGDTPPAPARDASDLVREMLADLDNSICFDQHELVQRVTARYKLESLLAMLERGR